MSTYSDASLILPVAPYIKDGKIYSLKPTDGTGDFDFSRATEATIINKDGLIETVGSNIPRLNYPLIDGVVSGCPSLLLEPTSTNLITYSEDFSQGYWAKTNATVISNSTISPDGTQNASSVTGTPSLSRIRVASIPITNDNLNRSASLFVKKEDTTSIFLLQIFMGGGTGVSYNIQVDLSNGTFIDAQSVSGSGTTPTNLGVEDYGSYWRIYVTGANNLTGNTTIDINILFNYGAYLGNFTPQGGTTTIWGAQLEEQSYATSYIPTNGSTVTRNAETCNGAGNASTFNDSEGVLFAEISAFENVRLGVSENSSSVNRIILGQNQNGSVFSLVTVGSSPIYTYSASGFSLNENIKVALKYKESDFALWINGVEVDNQSSGITFSSDTLNVLDFTGQGTNFYGNTKQIQYFDKALTDAELIALTQ